MARLAAYYQEDFHYPPVGYTSKQRKSAYVVYEDPNGNISQPPVYGYPDRSYPDNRMTYLQPPQPHKVKHKHSKKRYSYADTFVQRDVRDCYTDEDYYYVPGYEEGYYLQPVYQRDMRWVPGYLSPPSPLVDSGLSSQSSPSLETFQCSCSPRLEEPPQRCASRLDFGRPESRMMDSCRTESRMMDSGRPGSRMMDSCRPESQMTDYVPQIRYGKLGIVGEPPPEPQRRRRASARAASPVQESGGSASPPPSESSAASGSSACSGGRVAGEREIRELEAMLARCGLADRDLLDRAERRDLPTAHQRLARSRSDTFLFEPSFELRQPRAPPRRRSGLPDRVADDMALRKQRQIPRPPRPTALPASYMLCSPHFTPAVSPCAPPLPWQSDLPDADMDDLAYRRHYVGRSSATPQPPFGIPLRPPPLERRGSRADYLHVEPSRIPQPLCHPRGNPDVVRDDMAFRTLRKDEPERIYCDIAQVYERRR